MPGYSADTEAALRGVRRIAAELGRESLVRYVAGSPLYGGRDLPDHLFRESAHTVRVMVDVALRAVLGEEEDVAAALADVLERSGERAAEGLPMRSYLRCWQIGFGVLDEAVRERIPETDPDLPRVLAALRLVYDEVILDCATTYNRYTVGLAAARSDRESETIDRLLGGAPCDPETVQRAPERPIVVLADIGPCAAETSAVDAEARALAGRRKIRRLRGHVERHLAGVWLMDVRLDGARMIVHPTGGDRARVAADLNRVADAPVTLAFAPADSVADLPRAAGTARDVLRTALRMGRVGTAVSPEEVALPLHLGHPSAGLPALLDRCAPLLERAELVETARTYLDRGMDRRDTADALGVHPNTVDNRVARIRSLTGLDVRRAADLITVAIAVDPARGWADEPPAPGAE